LGRFKWVCIVAGMLLGAPVCWGHPDLLVQIDALTAQLGETPDNVALLLKRGDLYRRHQDYEAAATDFDQVAALDPGDPSLDFYRARLEQDTGNPQAADQLFSRYLQLRPGHAKAWKLRGEAGLALGDPLRAAGYFEKAIILTPNPSPELFRLQAMALMAAGEPQWPAAMDSVDLGLERVTVEVTLLGLGTDLSLAQGQTDRADELMRELPGKLLELPQWAERVERLNCFYEEDAPVCLAVAKTLVREYAASFMDQYLPQGRVK